ncbi:MULTISPECIES: hypothetical protein [Pseudomonas]|uniref:hypothetical protein n=1 Tax=Pseudomonas TaxID=286 RepID=UPI001A215F42|nr:MULTISPECIES: hypothetical protein [Pseudomonas]MBG6665250.1 hypothetical protein [Pseudomonas aeruginosa]MEC5073319.1 hypothetical protein [Pseudomonas aeruginosa]HBO3514085.1 hypothetical protein [Pseudomonas aeruginosa]HBO4194443.1 hypothetical protein [Pseudomonas aeruginosa]HBO4808038.1 hypothetical protein [Pseudomonas aeruginosa]
MERKSYCKGAHNNMTRGWQLFEQGKSSPEKYFYSALELRFGIESRLREYLEYQDHVKEKKKKGWQIAALGKDVEEAFSGCVDEVRVKVCSEGHPLVLFKYTPVVPDLKSIGERLGDYLHAPKKGSLETQEQWDEFESILERGFHLLEYACSGNLLGVPLLRPGSRQGIFNASVSEDQKKVLKALYAKGGDVAINAEYLPPPV